jgi:hypothetical protein
MTSYKDIFLRNITYFKDHINSIEYIVDCLVKNKEMTNRMATTILEERVSKQKDILYEHISKRISSTSLRTKDVFCKALNDTKQYDLLQKLFPDYVLLKEQIEQKPEEKSKQKNVFNQNNVFDSIQKAFDELTPAIRLVERHGYKPMVTTSTFRGPTPKSNISTDELPYLFGVKIGNYSLDEAKSMEGCPEDIHERYEVYNSEIDGVIDFIKAVENCGLDFVIWLTPDILHPVIHHYQKATISYRQSNCLVIFETFVRVRLMNVRVNSLTNIEMLKTACMLHLVCFSPQYGFLIRKSADDVPNCYLMNMYATLCLVDDLSVVSSHHEKLIVFEGICLEETVLKIPSIKEQVTVPIPW